MKIGIVGLGLIGGSLAKAAAAATPHTLYGADNDAAVLAAAAAEGVLAGALDAAVLPECDVVIVALFPAAAIAWLEQNAPHIKKGAVVFDCCGVKAAVCAAGFALAAKYGFTFFGGHPMAGTERSGWAAATPALFGGASMLLVTPTAAEGDAAPKTDAEKAADALLRPFFTACGFGRVVYTTADVHDRVIAYTSQLAHVVSSAYIKSPTALRHDGYSAGSFKDLTRVAYLNENMWTELFLDNRAPLLAELEDLIARLAAYRDALAGADAGTLKALLADGRRQKEQSDAARAQN